MRFRDSSSPREGSRPTIGATFFQLRSGNEVEFVVVPGRCYQVPRVKNTLVSNVRDNCPVYGRNISAKYGMICSLHSFDGIVRRPGGGRDDGKIK